MRRFLVLCFIAAATADNLGYSYQPAGHDAAIGGGFTGGSIASSDGGSIGSAGGAASSGLGGGYAGFSGGGDEGRILSHSNNNGGHSAFSAGISNDGGNFVSSANAGGFGSAGNTAGGSGISSGFDAAPVSSEFNKEFFTYSAPEEEFNDRDASQHIASSLKKNLRVVFIKAPENQGLANAALQLAKQASEDRTAIYVLNKQADIGDLANRLQSIKSSSANKPEVHFVKYRTPEDAQRAQQAIQAQYDSLGGQSRTSNEGVAPVLNFASSSAQAAPASSGGFVGSNAIGGGANAASGASSGSIHSGSFNPHTNNAYLPSALRLK